MKNSRGLRQNLPYLNGVYIAIDAVPDAYLLVDGPFCVVQKAEMHVGHSPATSLVSPAGIGRIVLTDLRLDTIPVHNLAADRGPDIQKALRDVAGLKSAGLVLLTSMDFHHLLNVPLERYARAAQKESRVPIAVLESRSLEGDWLDGYARALAQIARVLPLPAPRPAPDRVAIVGPLMDRREGDQLGNLAELRRLLAGLGLKTVSIWPCGEPTRALRAAHRAGTVVSLPYGRAAAKTLSERLGCPLVEAELPLGLGATARFLSAVGKATGRQARAEAFCSRETRRVTAAIKLLTHRHIAGRRAIVQADPYAALGLQGLLAELGVELAKLLIVAQERGLPEEVRGRLKACGAVFEPLLDLQEKGPGGLELDRETEAELVIAPSLFPHQPLRASWVPFGYPNYLSHPVAPRPFLGFSGMLWWAERLAEACVQAELKAGGTRLGGMAGTDEGGRLG